MKRLALTAAIALGLPALAQESGAYVRGFIGAPFLGSAGLKAPAAPAGQNDQIVCEQSPEYCPDQLVGSLITSGDVKSFSGIDFGAALGWRLNSQFRGELAFDYRNVDLDIPTASQGPPPTGIAGRIPDNKAGSIAPVGSDTFWSVMVNGIYDILFDPGQVVDPYIGVGVGWGNANIKAYNTGLLDVSGSVTDTPANGINDKSVAGLAFNVIAGLSYEFAEGVSGTLEYKYTNMLESEIDGLDGADTVKYKVGHNDHLVTVGVSYSFGGGSYTRRAPPPPPAPLPPPRPVAPPPPAPVINCSDQDQSVVVYFGLNKTSLAQEDTDSINNAISAARQNSCDISSVSIVGYTDRSGNAAYNKRLSEKRGDAVLAVIVDLGVNADLVEVTGAGELDNARPAQDGKVDALSRRAEIYVRAN